MHKATLRNVLGSLGVVAACLIGTGCSTSQVTTPTDAAGVLPETLDLPTLDVQSDWLPDDTQLGGVGVVWVDTEGKDPTSLLQNDRQRALYAEMLECFPEPGSAPEELFRAKEACFDALAIRAAATEPDPTDVFTAIAAMNTKRPDLFTVCHNASHRVGDIGLQRVVRKYPLSEELITRLLDRAGGSCMGGMMHGVLDAIGFIVTDVSQLSEVAAACLHVNPEYTGFCTDAQGHAAWDAFKDVSIAAEACSFFPEPMQRRECGEGLLMRMYQRLVYEEPWYNGRISDSEITRWNSLIVDICSQWPQTPFSASPNENPREWCWSGSVYLFSKPMFAALEESGGLYDEARNSIELRLKGIISACQTFPPDGAALCLDRIGVSVGHVSMFDKTESQRLCELFPDEFTRERCVTQAFQRIDSALNS